MILEFKKPEGFKLVSWDKEHIVLLNSWLNERGLHPALEQDIPKDGLMVYGRQGFIACGFIRKCEGGICLLDSFVTNPKASPEQRNDAMTKLVEELMLKAKSLGYNRILTFTQDKNTIERGLKLGFEIVHQTILGKAI